MWVRMAKGLGERVLLLLYLNWDESGESGEWGGLRRVGSWGIIIREGGNRIGQSCWREMKDARADV